MSSEIIFSCHIRCLSKDTKKKIVFIGKNLTSMAISKHSPYTLFIRTHHMQAHKSSVRKWDTCVPQQMAQGHSTGMFQKCTFALVKYWLFIVRSHIQDWIVYIFLQRHISESDPLAQVFCWYFILFIWSLENWLLFTYTDKIIYAVL